MRKLFSILIVVVFTTASFAQSNKPVTIKDGKLYQTTLFHEDGSVAQTGYYTKEGVLTGEWISYDVNGNKQAIAQYDNGKRVGTWLFYQGDTKKEVSYDNNAIAAVKTWKLADTRVVAN